MHHPDAIRVSVSAAGNRYTSRAGLEDVTASKDDESLWGYSLCRSCHLQPLFVRRAGLIRIDVNITVLVRLRFGDMYRLMPAVHSRDRVRMDGESDILMYAGIGPPNALTVSVCTNVSDRRLSTAHPPLTVVVVRLTVAISCRCPLPSSFQRPM